MLEFLRSLFRPDARRWEEPPQAEQARKLVERFFPVNTPAGKRRTI